jgi:ankyrin repeat protein
LRASLTASLLLLLLHPQTARMLLDIGANMNLYNKIGYTSFSCACMAGESAIVTYMISLGADVNGGSSKPLQLTCKGTPGKLSYR